jgi:hypothetical protein
VDDQEKKNGKRAAERAISVSKCLAVVVAVFRGMGEVIKYKTVIRKTGSHDS